MHRLRMRNDLRGTVETRENMLTSSPDRCHVLAQQLGRDPPPRVNDAHDIVDEQTMREADWLPR